MRPAWPIRPLQALLLRCQLRAFRPRSVKQGQRISDSRPRGPAVRIFDPCRVVDALCERSRRIKIAFSGDTISQQDRALGIAVFAPFPRYIIWHIGLAVSRCSILLAVADRQKGHRTYRYLPTFGSFPAGLAKAGGIRPRGAESRDQLPRIGADSDREAGVVQLRGVARTVGAGMGGKVRSAKPNAPTSASFLNATPAMSGATN